jgi:8-oxo-dGTP pyrophosphatase MutT (NUDIX family)
MISDSTLLTSEFIREVSNEFQKYLSFFPSEKNRLSILEKQLSESDRRLCDRKNMTGHLTASALLLNEDETAILLVYHNFLKLWLQPGGHLDPAELPLAGAFREFREETGITNIKLHAWHEQNKIPFDMDTHAIPANEKKDEGSHYHHDFQYLIILDKSAHSEQTIKIALDEVSQYRWVPITELVEKDHDHRLKRVAAKIKRELFTPPDINIT